jgi:uncharacterized protein YcbX
MVHRIMEELGRLAAIWRYPVKSLAGEALESARIEPGGIPGDRASALFVESGHARAGKTYRGKEHNLLHTTSSPERAVEYAGERGVTVALRAEPGTQYFDDAPVSLIFDRWIDEVAEALGMTLDPRRWRPNLFAQAGSEFAYRETDLLGCAIRVGEIVLRVRDRIGRCVTTTYDVETGAPEDAVLRYVAQQRDNTMGVYCDVELAGTVRLGDGLVLRER